MPEAPKSNTSKARAVIAKNLNSKANKAARKAAGFAKRNPGPKTAGNGRAVTGKSLNTLASRASKKASNFAKKNNPNLTPRSAKARKATGNRNASLNVARRTRG